MKKLRAFHPLTGRWYLIEVEEPLRDPRKHFRQEEIRHTDYTPHEPPIPRPQRKGGGHWPVKGEEQ